MFRVISAIVALIVLAPTGVGHAVCSAAEFDGVMPADCCCAPSEASVEVGPTKARTQPTIDAICCCEIDRPASDTAQREPASIETAAAAPAEAACNSPIDVAPPLAARSPVPDTPARAPPSGGWSLLSQGTSLLR